MSRSEIPCLSIAIAPLSGAGAEFAPSPKAKHYAIWVLQAPYPGGYVHHDRIWSETLSQTWQGWQQMFSLFPHPLPPRAKASEGGGLGSVGLSLGSETTSLSARLMQQLGLSLWPWLFDGPIQSSFAQSNGIAQGRNQPLRLRLDIRDPDLIALPWEIMQPRAGKPAISLDPQLRFSRTSTDVNPLCLPKNNKGLKVLLVLGENDPNSLERTPLQLEREARSLAEILENSGQTGTAGSDTVPSQVDISIQPTPAELIKSLESGNYNIFFYAGHGMPAPDGGQLLLRPGTTLSGIELAQVLVNCQVTLAVFNACWGAQPFMPQNPEGGFSFLARSSLAQVLIHHGVPAVLAMRDQIADRESLSLIRAFARALGERMPVDRAVALARQQLLTLYKFNQPAWTLPVLYMHPEFDGRLLEPLESLLTELPENSPTRQSFSIPIAYLRQLDGVQPEGAPEGAPQQSPQQSPQKVWSIRGGRLSVGRRSENDVAIAERWVSGKHAEIFCRDPSATGNGTPTYFLRDFSRYGTLILRSSGWQKVHHQEVLLESGTLIKFGSSQGQTLEFTIEG